MDEPRIVSLFIYGTFTFITLLVTIFTLLIRQNRRRYKYQNETKEREYQYRKELLNTQIELQENLLNEVSQEIHDNVGQVLSLVKVNLYTVATQVGHDKVTGLINISSELLDKAIDDLRNISHRNNADLLKRTGLQEALRKELDYLDGLKKQNCALEINGNHYFMTPERELLIYRIAQEAIHNCIKHAKASAVKVSLTYDPQFFMLQISDNGTGFDTADIASSAGIGLSHMRHRAKVLQSELTINSKLSQGTTVTLKMPNLYE